MMLMASCVKGIKSILQQIFQSGLNIDNVNPGASIAVLVQ
jgi:hypothetical protein